MRILQQAKFSSKIAQLFNAILFVIKNENNLQLVVILLNEFEI